MSIPGDIALHVENLSKEFKIYARPADMFIEMMRGRAHHKSFWALQDVSFDVRRGQVVGIMGRNGAGKSTLLKIISGTLDKTSGAVMTRGRISSILELGTGFNPEYTGRENIYLGGLMVGMSSREIKEKEGWIIEFSELRDFIDQPFKTYSSGMQARLTFSTAVCIDPDILVVDEALAVGDARFARKSFAKMEEFRKEGRTILLVSHNSNQVASFCDHALILEHGRVYDQGDPSRLRGVYYDLLFGKGDGRVEEDDLPSHNDVNSARKSDIKLGDAEYILDSNVIEHESGYCWVIDLSHLPIEGDNSSQPNRSDYVLYEDGQPAGAGHSSHDFIRNVGKGFFSHWGKTLLFSTSDNSDPRSNGRTYSLKRDDMIEEAVRDGEPPERRAMRQAALQKLGLKKPTFHAGNSGKRFSNGRAEFLDFGILDEHRNRVTNLISGRKYVFFSYAVFYQSVAAAATGLTINNINGLELYGVNSVGQKKIINNIHMGSIIETRVELTMWLTNGTYFLTVAVSDPDATDDVHFDLFYDAMQFDVEPLPKIHATSIVNLDETFFCNIF